MRLRTAVKFVDRLRGWWPRPPSSGEDVLRLPRCNSVHTFAMRVPIDIIFIGENGRVLKVCESVPAWRVRRHGAAKEVWELRAGEARRLGFRVGGWVPDVEPSMPGKPCMTSLRLNRRRSHRERDQGASMLEVLIALVLVIGPLSTALLEYSQLAVARYGLQHAIAETARATERSEVGNDSATSLYLRRVLAHHLLPAASTDSPERVGATSAASAALAVHALALRPDQLGLDLKLGRIVGGEGVLGAQEIHLHATWCRPMYFPPAKQFIGAVAGWLNLGPFDALCFATGGFPLRAEARAWRPLSRPPLISP